MTEVHWTKDKQQNTTGLILDFSVWNEGVIAELLVFIPLAGKETDPSSKMLNWIIH